MKNREAGVFITDQSGNLFNWYEAVFNGDFQAGVAFNPTQTYSSSDMAIITNTDPVDVVIPSPVVFNTTVYVTQLNPVTAMFNLTTYASPDYARATLEAALEATQRYLAIEIYQITDVNLCNDIINLVQNNNVQLQLLVSNRIYSYDDWKAAQTCYKSMYNAGITIQKTEADTYTYTHAKFWIADNTTVGLSSGNISPSDITPGSSFPPYGQSGWQDVNRDLNVLITQPDIVAQFQTVLQNDYNLGTSWSPSSGVTYIHDEPDVTLGLDSRGLQRGSA